MIELTKDVSINESKTSKQIYDQLRASRGRTDYNLSGTYGGYKLPAFIDYSRDGQTWRLYFDKDGEKGKLIKIMTRGRDDSMSKVKDVTLYKRNWWN